MDTPKQGVSWLENFPNDIWAYFAQYLSGEQLGRLMMTGATHLRRRLKSPNVLKSIKLGQDLMTFKSLPKFLNGLPSLEDLSLFSRDDEWSLRLGLTIASIPCGVRKLELSGAWNKCASKLFGECGTKLKLNERLPHLECLDLWWLEFVDYSWMAHLPQNLTTLRIDDWNGEVALPTTLIDFKVNTVALSVHSFVPTVPLALASFVVTGSLDGVDLVVPLLPHSTIQLLFGRNIKYVDPFVSSQKALEQLPKFLTHLELPYSDTLNFETNPALISMLPSTLIELRISAYLPCSAWPLLPPQLKKLAFKAPESLCTVISDTVDSDQVGTFPFETLPRSLTNLELISCNEQYFCGFPASSDRSYFPPHLIYLRIPDIQLSTEAAKLLPSSLTHLEIGNFCEAICKYLPNGLKTFVSSRTLMSPNLIHHLPKSLTLLELTYHDDAWYDYHTGTALDDITELSEHVIHRKCTANRFDWKGSSPLPLQLTSLKLADFDELGDSFLLNQQFLNLQKFRWDGSNFLTDLAIPLLSRHLTVLELLSSSMISGKSFKCLPRSLTYLNLESSESIFDSDIQHLPRTLLYAYLDHAIHLTEMCIPDLPPHMETLYMPYNDKIPPSSFPHFPQTLRSCCQSSTSVLFSKWSIRRGAIISESP